jgi:hypothetical protein
MSQYHGNIALGATLDIKFTTVDTSGVPTTLAGTPAVAAYPGNSVTEITAGITLTVDFDARTGLHNVRVIATSGNGYAAGTNYALVITAGTVGGSSVVGYVVGSFSIENRYSDAQAISGDKVAADNLETMLDGTGGQALTLGRLTVSNTAGTAVLFESTGGNGHGLHISGNGSGEGVRAQGGATGHGIQVEGGSTSGDGINVTALGSGHGISAVGVSTGNGISAACTGSGSGILAEAGTTGNGISAIGGVTSGDGIRASAPTLGDGIEAIGAGGGFDINADIQGSLSGSVGSVVGAVGSVLADVSITNADIAQIVDEVWDEDIDIAHQTANTAGKRLDDASTTIASNLNTTVSSRSSHSAADVWAVATRELSTTGIDAIFNRPFSAIETANPTATTDRTLLQALRFLRNLWNISGTTLSVKKEDDTTNAWTATLTTTAGADPITASDPS